MKFRLANNPQQGAQSLGGGIGAAIQAYMMGDQVKQQAADEAMDMQAKRDLVGAQSRAALAQSDKDGQEAAQIGDQRARASFPELVKSAAFQFGVPQQSMPDLEQVLNTGQLPSQYQPPADGRGPVMPAPDFLSPANLAKIRDRAGGINQALAVGDKSVENIAKAAGIYRDMGLEDRAIAGQVSPLVLAQTKYAMKGSDPFKFNEYGIGNALTGSLDTANPAAQTFGRLRQSEIGENNSTTARNLAEYGKTTKETQFVGMPKPTGGAAGPAKLTEGEAKATLYLSQMQEASKVLDRMDDSGKTPFPVQVAMADSTWTNWAAGEDSQVVNQAKRQWAEAYLRAKTGAAATGSEIDNNIRTFFPVVGDSDGVVTRKRAARKEAEAAMLVPSGRGSERLPGASSGGASASWGDSVNGAPAAQPGKVMTMADVEATAQRSGRSVQDVIKAAQSRGFTVR